MNAPLRMTFDVDCSVEHAFAVWTSGIGTWWPRDHTVTGRAEVVVLQSGVGGRIYERTADGAEHDWGEVTVWEPPRPLGLPVAPRPRRRGRHRGRDPFRRARDRATRVEIEHRGWERLGAAAEQWRNQNRVGWDAIRIPRRTT